MDWLTEEPGFDSRDRQQMFLFHKKSTLALVIWLAHQLMHIHKIVYINTFKIAPTCFDPEIIIRELRCSLQGTAQLPDDDRMIETCRRDFKCFNLLTPNDPYMGRTAPLPSKRCILYIYSTNTGTEYFKHALYSPFFLFKMQFVS